MKSCSELRREGRYTLRDCWGQSLLTNLLVSVFEALITPLGAIFLAEPLELGFLNVLRECREGEKDSVCSRSFRKGFEDGNYFHYVGGMFLTGLFIFLWGLLLIIPGIIMAYAYAMVPFILHDNPGLDAMDAIKQSKEMMRGHKWHLFCLELSFIGWFLLCLLTLGIGFLWLYPYIKASKACFYNDLVSEA